MYFPVPAVLTEFLILAILESKDSYGYEICQTIKLISTIKESALYPILKKLEQNDFLVTYSREYQGRMRKYYSLTQLGHEQLILLKDDWDTYTNTINGIIEGSIRHDKN
ncbi:PadR family transcriptional regulator [Streptococcus suis]|nr:PadR family transcriptional regulator [Streptococcus suis]